MSDELKNKLDIFVKNIIIRFGNKKEDIPEIQKEYDELIEFYEKLTILTNEEFTSLDKAMNKYDAEYGIVVSNKTDFIEKEDDVIFIPPKTFSFL